MTHTLVSARSAGVRCAARALESRAWRMRVRLSNCIWEVLGWSTMVGNTHTMSCANPYADPYTLFIVCTDLRTDLRLGHCGSLPYDALGTPCCQMSHTAAWVSVQSNTIHQDIIQSLEAQTVQTKNSVQRIVYSASVTQGEDKIRSPA